MSFFSKSILLIILNCKRIASRRFAPASFPGTPGQAPRIHPDCQRHDYDERASSATSVMMPMRGLGVVTFTRNCALALPASGLSTFTANVHHPDLSSTIGCSVEERVGLRVSPAAHRFVNFTHNRHCGPPLAFNITTGDLQNAPASASYPHRHLAASFTHAPAEIPRLFGGFGFSKSILLIILNCKRIASRRFAPASFPQIHPDCQRHVVASVGVVLRVRVVHGINDRLLSALSPVWINRPYLRPDPHRTCFTFNGRACRRYNYLCAQHRSFGLHFGEKNRQVQVTHNRRRRNLAERNLKRTCDLSVELHDTPVGMCR